MKKFISIIMTLMFLVGMSGTNQILASDKQFSTEEIKAFLDTSTDEVTVITDEIEHIKKIKSYTKTELYELGCTDEEVEYILNYDYNKALLNYSQKDNKDLKRIGLNDKQIQALKNYDGISDAVTYIEVNNLSFASLTFRMSRYASSRSQFVIFYEVTWSSEPIFLGTDIIAFAWNACDINSYNISMRVQDAYCSREYYNKFNNSWSRNATKLLPTDRNFNNVSFYVPLDGGVDYVKRMTGFIDLRTQSNSNNLSTIQIHFSYGHSTVTLSPTVTFSAPPAIGITFNWTMQTEHSEIRTYDYNGNQL